MALYQIESLSVSSLEGKGLVSQKVPLCSFNIFQINLIKHCFNNIKGKLQASP